MDFNFRILLSFAFSIGILVEGIISISKKGNKGYGVFSIIAAVLFLAASVLGAMRIGTVNSPLLLPEWILYGVGFVIFIIGLIVRKKASAK